MNTEPPALPHTIKTISNDAQTSWTTRARQRIQKWLRPPRQLAITPAGKILVFLTIAIGFGAINTGNNLLFLLLGMMLSLLVISGILSEAVIRHVIVKRSAPSRVFARKPAVSKFLVQNTKSWSSLSVEISEDRTYAVDGPLKNQRFGPIYHPWWKVWKRYRDKIDADRQAVAKIFILDLPGRSQRDFIVQYDFPSRGRFRLEGLSISTRFPFSFADKAREIDLPIFVTVFPHPDNADDWVSQAYAKFGDISANKSGHGEEYFGLRDFRDGEDRRQIHWKSSARRQHLVVREYQQQEQRAIELCLYNFTAKSPAQRYLYTERFEAGLEKLTGLIDTLTRRGFQLSLRTTDSATAMGDSTSHHDHILSTLALIALHDTPRPLYQSSADGSDTSDHFVGRIHLGFSQSINISPDNSDLILTFDDEYVNNHQETAKVPIRQEHII